MQNQKALFTAAQNTLRYYEATDPGRKCLIDNLNPCGGLAHWGKGIGCPLCSARAAINTTEGEKQ